MQAYAIPVLWQMHLAVYCRSWLNISHNQHTVNGGSPEYHLHKCCTMIGLFSSTGAIGCNHREPNVVARLPDSDHTLRGNIGD